MLKMVIPKGHHVLFQLSQEKERQLEAKNIYSNRFLKPASYSGTPTESPAASFRTNLLKKKSGSVTDLTPRDKAKAYEDRRRAEQDEKKKEKVSVINYGLTILYLSS
jgi:hypothetical protein